MSAFYKAVMNGVYNGKDNQNILWYRTAIDPLGGIDGVGGAVTLADAINTLVVPSFLQVKPAGYMLESIDVYPHNELLQLLYQLPYKKRVMQAGTSGIVFDGSDGPGLCVNLRFNLEPTLIGVAALTAPKRGYLAIGPLASAWVDDWGKLSDTILTPIDGAFQTLANALSSNVESILPPALFFPIRVSQKWGVGSQLGQLISWGYADISSATWDPFTSYRRSRRITG